MTQMPDDLDRQATTYLGMFAAEFQSITDYTEKLDRLFKYTTPIFDQIPQVKGVRVCNGIYAYTFDHQISLIKTSQILGQLKTPDGISKYGVAFHNWGSRKQIRIAIPLGGEMPPDEDGKIPAHRFTVFQSGAVKQYSPTSSKIALLQLEDFVSDIKRLVFSEI